MYSILQHAHSGLRWILLIMLIYAIYRAFSSKGNNYEDGDRKIYLFTMVICHIQLLIGAVLYYISPFVQFGSETMKNSQLRFYTVEHISLMLIAILLVTLGYTKGKKALSHNITFKYYLIGLILILISIPWPFRNLGAGWF